MVHKGHLKCCFDLDSDCAPDCVAYTEKEEKRNPPKEYTNDIHNSITRAYCLRLGNYIQK